METTTNPKDKTVHIHVNIGVPRRSFISLKVQVSSTLIQDKSLVLNVNDAADG